MTTSTPFINTILLEPALQELQAKILQQAKAVDEWFANEWRKTPPPFYGSIDLRNAGFKIAPIDMNLFPAGFNNLNPNFYEYASSAAIKALHALVPEVQSILLLPENHSRNLFYWENIATLAQLLTATGLSVTIGSLENLPTERHAITLPSGRSIEIHAVSKKDHKLLANQMTADVVLLNNDLSAGIPELLHDIQQPIIPPAKLGWSHRLKSGHFTYYAETVKAFADQFNFDAWLLAPLFRHCGAVDFMQQEGMTCVYEHAKALFTSIEEKYAQYNITAQPFVIIKADAGTYGMAVMTIRNIDELQQLNRKQRTRMAKIKGGQDVHSVIIQEGVYTIEKYGEHEATAEPVVYLMGDKVIGGFYRFHPEKGDDENLNSPGMAFQPIAFPVACHERLVSQVSHPHQDLYYFYGIIAKLSMLAAAKEIKDQI